MKCDDDQKSWTPCEGTHRMGTFARCPGTALICGKSALYSSHMIIIGVTGTIGAGKGTIVSYLETKGFRHYSSRKFIVAEIERRSMPVNRDSMTIVANDLRATHSPSYIVEELYKEAAFANTKAIIESIRTEGEIVALRKRGNFYLFAVDADPETRYKRIVSRGNETDRISYEKFLEDEAREMHSTDPTKQNLSRCIELADFRLVNNGTIEKLHRQIDKILAEIDKGQGSEKRTIL
jgi:dephospho-CoA kinase